ncbi:RNA polymerase sigma factor [Flavobacteriaceae sp. LMIT009]|jgi:RNA polymerase sigma-70 factor (ECF subfamily)
MKDPLKVIQLYKNEAQLIKKAKRNDREAQHKLYELHASKMLSICRYYIRDVQHAEDVMIKGFFKVFTKLSGYSGNGSFEGWMRRIMVNEAISFLRAKKNIEFSTEEVTVPEHTSNNINTALEVSEIQQLIDDLPEGYRMVFVMYAIEGYKHSEISKMLNISEGTSKSQLFKARQLLQQQLTKLNKINNGTNEI